MPDARHLLEFRTDDLLGAPYAVTEACYLADEQRRDPVAQADLDRAAGAFPDDPGPDRRALGSPDGAESATAVFTMVSPPGTAFRSQQVTDRSQVGQGAGVEAITGQCWAPPLVGADVRYGLWCHAADAV